MHRVGNLVGVGPVHLDGGSRVGGDVGLPEGQVYAPFGHDGVLLVDEAHEGEGGLGFGVVYTALGLVQGAVAREAQQQLGQTGFSGILYTNKSVLALNLPQRTVTSLLSRRFLWRASMQRCAVARPPTVTNP